MKIASYCLGLFGLCLTLVAAQDPKDTSKDAASKGLKGELVPAPFRSYIVVDDRFPLKVAGSKKAEDRDPKDRTDKMHDLVTENGLNPVIAVIVREDAKKLNEASGVSKLVREMNKLMTLPEYRGAKLAGFVIFLKLDGPPKTITVVGTDKSETKVDLDAEYPDDEKRDDPYAEDIRQLAKLIKAPNVVFGMGPAKSAAAAAWSVAEDDQVTVIVFNRIRVINRWKFQADAGPTDDEIKQIIATAEESITGDKK